jgi:hypothetical protein
LDLINQILLLKPSRNLNSLTEILTKYPDTDIVIQGHTDDKGSDSYNQDLSERRAQAVSNYLISKIFFRSRFSTVGYGETVHLSIAMILKMEEPKTEELNSLITANEKMKEDARKEAEIQVTTKNIIMKTTKKLLTVLLGIFFKCTLFAQGFGIRAGVNFQNINGKDFNG